MSFEINLLREQQKPEIARLVKIKKIITSISVVILNLFIMSVVFVFLFNIYLVSQIEKTKQQVATLKEQITKEKSTESLYLAYLEKISSISQVMLKQLDTATFLGKVKAVTPEKAEVDVIGLNQQSADLTFEVTGDLNTIDLVLHSLQDQETLNFEKITMVGMSKNEDGSYSTGFNVLIDVED